MDTNGQFRAAIALFLQDVEATDVFAPTRLRASTVDAAYNATAADLERRILEAANVGDGEEVPRDLADDVIDASRLERRAKIDALEKILARAEFEARAALLAADAEAESAERATWSATA